MSWLRIAEREFRKSSFMGRQFGRRELTKANREATLNKANLKKANLTDAVLYEAQMPTCEINGSEFGRTPNLKGQTLYYATLTKARF